MAIDLGDSTFRPLLRDDMKDAWSLVQVHYDAPQTPGSLAQLPRGFLQCGNLDEVESQGFSKQNITHPYELSGQFVYPEDMTLEEAKFERAEELLSVLTGDSDSNIYKSAHRYRYMGTLFEESRISDDSTERYYTVTIRFGLLWETGI